MLSRRSTPWVRRLSCRALGFLIAGTFGPLHAQTILESGDSVIINCPDQVELQVLVDYVGKSLDVRFLYGEELKGQHVELRPSPVEIPRARLLSLLGTLLRVRDLVMIEQEPGLYRIVKSEDAARNVLSILPTGATPSPDSSRLVTQVVEVPSGQVTGLAEKLAKFASSPKGGIDTVPERGLLIITDYESRIATLAELVRLLDAGSAPVEVRTFPITSTDAATLATQVTMILGETHRLRQLKSPPPSVRGDVLPGSIVAIGSTAQVAEAAALINKLTPTAEDLSTKPYTPRYLGVDRARKLIESVALAPGSGLPAPAGMYVDSASGRLFVTAGAATHRAIATLLESEDKPLPETQRPLRVYHPRHRKAAEVLATLTQLLGEGVRLTTVQSTPFTSPTSKISEPPGPNRPPAPASPVQVPPVPPAQVPRASEAPPARTLVRVEGPDYVLTEDEHTNAILAIGTREFHAQLETLLEQLDHRRPQVLIEMKLVAVTMSDTRDLGLELEHLDLGDGWDYLLFSSFGLSQIDPTSGARTLIPGPGANGVLLNPDEVPVILKALATHGLGHVMSTPKLLVADNAHGTLRNVDEAPFTSVNASDTVATTSFGGFESAGTTLSVTPHISQGDHLNLEFELTFSNFSGGSASVTVPPPRTTNSFSSTVEVPDGYTVITGGLTVDNFTDSTSEVPLLGRIPILGKAFQSNTRKKNKTRIYAFITPTILREDRFEDLKLLSLKDLEKAELPAEEGAPPFEPLWMD